MMVVIVVVPIMLGAPAVAIFIPPAMGMLPTPGPRLGQFRAILCNLRAVPAVMFGSFVKFVIRANDALLTVVIRAHRSGAREEKRGA